MAADPMTRTAVDDIFDDTLFDLEDDPFTDKPAIQDTRDDKPTLSPRASAKRKAGDIGDQGNFELGLDEEVKIAKKRKPIAKLDEARLLSEPGIPKIRALVRSKQLARKLRFKGKGHEFDDAARLLKYYQLWLDNLYPRAKFADALQLVEKAGHTKRMQMMRSEWINEGKPGYISSSAVDLDVEIRADEMPDLFGGTNTAQRENALGNSNEDSMFIPDQGSNEIRLNVEDRNQPEDDELDALLAMQDDPFDPAQRPNLPAHTRADDSEGEDDLDALLAEQDARQTQPPSIPIHTKTPNPVPEQDDEVGDADIDDLDALLAEQESRQNQPQPTRVLNKDDSQEQTIPADLDDEDEEEVDGDGDDDLMAALRESEQRQNGAENTRVGDTSGQPVAEKESQPKELHDTLLSSSPVPNEEG